MIAAGWLKKRYGDQFDVEFVEMTDSTVAERFADVRAAVAARGWALPAVTIDGELVPMEFFSAWALADVIEDWLATKKVTSQLAGR